MSLCCQVALERKKCITADDILVLHMEVKPIMRKNSQDWNTHISYAEDGKTVEVVVLEADANNALPIDRHVA